MMQTVFAWLLLGFILLAAYPCAAWLLSHTQRHDDFWLPVLLALALGVGTLTLLMFWLALLGLPFQLWTITLLYFTLMLPGWLLWKRHGLTLRLPRFPASRLERFALVLIGLVSAAVLFNSGYWPFYRDDTLGIYARYAKIMYESGALVPFAGRDDAFYQAYPVQIPLAYTYTYLASGWVNEYLARLIPALFSLGCLPAAYVLGKLVYNGRAGWLAALLLATTPAFARWASSGYVDLPMAFLYTLSAIFAWRLWQNGSPADALLAGLTMGLAAWAKNAALMAICFLAAWLVYGWLRRRYGFQQIILALGVCAVVAAPWYIRNWIEARLIVPPTAWVDQAEPTLTNLLVFATRGENFALTGWVILGGVLAAGFRIISAVGTRCIVSLHTDHLNQRLFLLWWTLPFFVVWWLLVSYDPRFLLLFLPLLAVLGGGWLSALWDKLPNQWQRRAAILASVVLLALVVYNAWIAVDYKREILQNPLMSDTEKHAIVLPSGR